MRAANSFHHLTALGLLLASSAAFAESRGFAISLVHTATYTNKDDCPRGGNGTISEIHQRIMVESGMTKEQAVAMLKGDAADAGDNKANAGDAAAAAPAQPRRRFDFDKRGHVSGQLVNIGNFPTSVPDDNIELVDGKGRGHFAYGFNLAGATPPESSFEDPDTHELVQDQMWRVLGCFSAYQYRLPGIPYNEGVTWDTAEDAMPAWLVWISGGDLSKDGDVKVTFDRALHLVLRDAHGALLHGSTYAVDPDKRSHSEFKGHIKDHVVTIEPGNFFMQGESQFYSVLRFTQTHLRITLNEDGTFKGFIGGYQPWLDYYHYLAIRGQEDSEVDLPGVYYAMRRLAEAAPDPKTGQNTAISATYYIEGAEVFVTDAAGKVLATPSGRP